MIKCPHCKKEYPINIHVDIINWKCWSCVKADETFGDLK